MPLDEYASASSGGALKLKGSKVSKSKKKKRDKTLEKSLSAAAESDGKSKEDDEATVPANDDGGIAVVKTEAQRRYEEARRKRLIELADSPGAKPELLKSHKERVEELNTFLSKLSEHNDMPKIGPG